MVFISVKVSRRKHIQKAKNYFLISWRLWYLASKESSLLSLSLCYAQQLLCLTTIVFRKFNYSTHILGLTHTMCLTYNIFLAFSMTMNCLATWITPLWLTIQLTLHVLFNCDGSTWMDFWASIVARHQWLLTNMLSKSLSVLSD